LGITITRKPEEVLIEEDLQNFLLTQYAGQGITVNETKSIILQLKSLSASDLYESNKTFLKMLSDGFILKTRRPKPKRHLHSTNQLCRT
jgi:type I restriction enzyme R subunit